MELLSATGRTALLTAVRGVDAGSVVGPAPRSYHVPAAKGLTRDVDAVPELGSTAEHIAAAVAELGELAPATHT